MRYGNDSTLPDIWASRRLTASSQSSRPAPRLPPRRANRIRSDKLCGIPPRFPVAISIWDRRFLMAPTAFVAITTMDTTVAPFPASSYTVRGARSVMDSTGRQIAAEGVDATTSRPRDAFHIGKSWNMRVTIPDRIRNECIHERSIHSRRFRTFLLKAHLPIRLHSMPSAYNICWLIC